MKLTKSGKAVQIVDDDGRVYQTSVNSVMYLLGGKAKGGFITTVRLPFNAAPDRFKPSELWDPKGVFQGDAAKTLDKVTTGNDAFSESFKKDKEEVESFQDKDVW